MQQGGRLVAVAPVQQQLVEETPVRQPGQAVVQRVVFHLGARLFEFAVAQLGIVLGLHQSVVEPDIGRHVPIDADDMAVAANIVVHGADGSNPARRSAGNDDTELRGVGAADRDRLFELRFGLCTVVRMQRRRPVADFRPFVVTGDAVELPHAIVPDKLPGIDIELPHADLRRVERQFEPLRQFQHLVLTPPQLPDVGAALIVEIAGDGYRQDDEQAGENDETAHLPGVFGCAGPAATRNCGNPPAARRQGDFRNHRRLVEDGGRPEKDRAVVSGRVAPRYGNIDRKIEIEQTAIPIELPDVDDGGNESPQMPGAIVVIGENRKASNEALATLQEIDRACQHHVP
jgi:hypothetical protein